MCQAWVNTNPESLIHNSI
ncbi:hypothetical protein YPPY89_3800, partial [Yersinia pestis PY-89]